MSESRLFKWVFLHPRYWLLWIGIGSLYLVCMMPLRTRWAIGSLLGRSAYHLARHRRDIVQTNIALCFPDLSAREQDQLVRDNFVSSGISLIETALVWFKPAESFVHLVDIEGLEHLRQARSEGKGVLLVGMHLSTLDFCGAVLACFENFDVMYRRNKNPLLEAVMTLGRQRTFLSAIERSDVRGVIRRLRQGSIVWYGPDQDYGRKVSVFAPFFGVPAATITATSRIAGMTDAAVIVFSHYRNLQNGRYRIHISPPLADFPSDDEQDDCRRINQLIEDAIRQAPEQYWWVHRRFKTRPPGLERPYAKA